MCLAVYQRPGAELNMEHIINAWASNPHGGGFAHFKDDGSLSVFKTMDLLEYLEAYEEAWEKYGQQSAFVLHMRYATHGSTDEFNVHPFQMDEHTLVAHNGIIRTLPQEKTDKRSDTQFFVDEYLRSLPSDWMDNPYLFDMVQDYIGYGNKLIILTNRPGLKYNGYIVNQKAGHWRSEDTGDIWYSNHSYLSYSIKSTSKPAEVKKALETKTDDTSTKTADTKADGDARPFGVVTVSAGALVEEVDGSRTTRDRCIMCGSDQYFDTTSEFCSRCYWCSYCDAPYDLGDLDDDPDLKVCDCYEFDVSVEEKITEQEERLSIFEMTDQEIAALN